MILKEEEIKSDLKMKAILNSTLARQIGEYVATLISNKAKVSSVEDLYPYLFRGEEENSKEKVEKDLVIYKENMKSFVQRHNSKKEWKEVKK